MPELPDVETFRRHVAATSLHQRIKATHVPDARVLEKLSARRLASRLKGKQFKRTERHGKYLVVDADNGALAMHFGMTGRAEHVKADDEVPRHTRVQFDFSDGSHLAYVCQRMLGRVFLVDSTEALVAQKELGPDALDVERREFCNRLEEKRSGSIKAALMDQSTIAGIGNVYSDEILFQCRLHPATSIGKLDRRQLGRLHQVTQRVLKTAIRYHANPEEMPKSYLLPQRGGGECPRCGGPLKKAKVAGRSAVFCPRCQQKA